jgi:hypothetical protein
MSPLETLRALSRNDVPCPKDERNEKNEQSCPEQKVVSSNSFSSSPGGFECGTILATWVEGYVVLCAMSPPAGFSTSRWHGIVDAAGIFIDRWASQAAACSWSTLDIFGAHPARPNARFDAMGLVMLLNRGEITDIDAMGADLLMTTGGCQRFYRRPLPAETVPLWELPN